MDQSSIILTALLLTVTLCQASPVPDHYDTGFSKLMVKANTLLDRLLAQTGGTKEEHIKEEEDGSVPEVTVDSKRRWHYQEYPYHYDEHEWLPERSIDDSKVDTRYYEGPRPPLNKELADGPAPPLTKELDNVEEISDPEPVPAHAQKTNDDEKNDDVSLQEVLKWLQKLRQSKSAQTHAARDHD